nr:hypothetical protein [Solirubrobacterales bacterium]
VQYMQDFAARLEGTGEFVDGQALSPDGTFVRSDGEGRSPVTDGPFAETKDLIAGWMVIDVDTYERALRRKTRPEREGLQKHGRARSVGRTVRRAPADGAHDDVIGGRRPGSGGRVGTRSGRRTGA